MLCFASSSTASVTIKFCQTPLSIWIGSQDQCYPNDAPPNECNTKYNLFVLSFIYSEQINDWLGQNSSISPNWIHNIERGDFRVLREAHSAVNVSIIDCLKYSIFRFLCLDHHSFAKGNNYKAWKTGAAFCRPGCILFSYMTQVLTSFLSRYRVSGHFSFHLIWRSA